MAAAPFEGALGFLAPLAGTIFNELKIARREAAVFRLASDATVAIDLWFVHRKNRCMVLQPISMPAFRHRTKPLARGRGCGKLRCGER